MFTPDFLEGRVAIITGGGTGIGKAIAEDLAAHGANVVLAARQLDRLEDLVQNLSRGGKRALAVATDVSEPDQVRRLFDAVDAEFGKVDILVNNAAANFIRPSETLTPVRWKKIIDIVLNGSFYCAREAGRRMIERKTGTIINMVAAYAWRGGPGLAPSASAKAGVVALTRSLGVEWARHGIRVNAICPGFIDTAQSRQRLWPEEWMREIVLEEIPNRRFGSEKDISNLILFLTSDMAGYINGEVIVADAGESLGKGALKIIEKAGIVRRSKGK